MKLDKGFIAKYMTLAAFAMFTISMICVLLILAGPLMGNYRVFFTDDEMFMEAIGVLIGAFALILAYDTLKYI